MSDVSFDSQKHDQTRHDAEQGGEHLGNAAKAAEAFAQAQTASVWGKEPGVEAARLALQAAYTGAGEGFAAKLYRLRREGGSDGGGFHADRGGRGWAVGVGGRRHELQHGDR